MGLIIFGHKVAREIIQLFVTVLIILWSPITITFIPLWYFYRGAVQLVAKYFRPDLDKVLKGLSALLALDRVNERPKVNLVVCAVFSSKLNIHIVKSTVQHRVINKCKPNSDDLLYPELRQYWTSFGNYLFWKWDKQFNLDNHVKMYDRKRNEGGKMALPNPCDENDICKVMEELLVRPWKKERSPWEVLIVDNYQPVVYKDKDDGVSECQGQKIIEGSENRPQQSVLILSWSHALADGYSFLNLAIKELAIATETKDSVIQSVAQPKLQKLSLRQRLGTYLALPFRLPYDAAGNIVEAWDGSNTWHRLHEKLSRQYYLSLSRPISVNFIKEIKKLHGVSYISVLFAGLSGGIRRIMEEAGQDIPKYFSVAVPLPMGVHPGGIINHMTAACIKLPIRRNKNETAEAHLTKTFKRMSHSKYYTGHLVNYLTFKAFGAYPNFLKQLVYSRHMHTMIVSNFPGPEEPIPIFESSIVELFCGSGLGAGKMGATTPILTLCGKQRFLTTIDKTIFPSEKLFARLGTYIEEELKELHEAGTI